MYIYIYYHIPLASSNMVTTLIGWQTCWILSWLGGAAQDRWWSDLGEPAVKAVKAVKTRWQTKYCIILHDIAILPYCHHQKWQENDKIWRCQVAVNLRIPRHQVAFSYIRQHCMTWTWAHRLALWKPLLPVQTMPLLPSHCRNRTPSFRRCTVACIPYCHMIMSSCTACTLRLSGQTIRNL